MCILLHIANSSKRTKNDAEIFVAALESSFLLASTGMNKLEKQIGKIWRTVRGKSQSRYKEDEEEAMEERERSSSLGRIRGRERRRDKENGAEEWEGFGYSTSPHLALPKRASRVSSPSVAFKKKIKRTQPLEKEKRLVL